MTEARSQPWLTVVTVSLRDDDALDATSRSVDAQGVQNIEHIVIVGEGPSIKSTPDLASSYRRTVYEPPRGVYQAMNTGLTQARGTLVHFLNAGDRYAESNVLQRVRDTFEATRFEWAFGRMLVSDTPDSPPRLRGSSLEVMQVHRFRGRHFPEHPTVFARVDDLQRLGGFDTSYRTAADYRLILALTTTSEGLDLGFPVTRYTLGGLSDTSWVTSVRECHRARREVRAPRGWSAMEEDLFLTRELSEQALRRAARHLRRVTSGRIP